MLNSLLPNLRKFSLCHQNTEFSFSSAKPSESVIPVKKHLFVKIVLIVYN